MAYGCGLCMGWLVSRYFSNGYLTVSLFIHSHDLVKRLVWELLLNKPSRTLRKYIANDYIRKRDYLAAAVRYPVFSQGINWLCRMRVGAIWTVRRFVRIRWLPERYLTECPFCGVVNDTGEDLQHLLIQCQAWAEYRHEANLGLVGEYEILLGGSRNIGEAEMDRVVNEGLMYPPDEDLNPELHAQMGDDDGADVELVPRFIKVAKINPFWTESLPNDKFVLL